MAFGTITSTSNTFGSVDGTATGVVAGTLSGSIGVPGPAGPTGPQGPAGAAGQGVPAGGTAGQFLQKTTTGVDYATDWTTINLSAYAVKANNLSDLTNAGAARNNLGLGATNTVAFTTVNLAGTSGSFSTTASMSGVGNAPVFSFNNPEVVDGDTITRQAFTVNKDGISHLNYTAYDLGVPDDGFTFNYNASNGKIDLTQLNDAGSGGTGSTAYILPGEVKVTSPNTEGAPTADYSIVSASSNLIGVYRGSFFASIEPGEVTIVGSGGVMSILSNEIQFPDESRQTTAFPGFANAALTGNPTAPTAALGDNDTSIATTAFVQQELLSGTANARNLEVQVRNQSGSTITAGSIVYISGATGNLPLITKAQANNDANSAQTIGFTKTSIANNGTGYVIVRGVLENIDTSALTEGVQLYLSPSTAGTWTTTKPSAPQHLVYVGVVIRSHPTLGTILVAVQNGLELEELHNVSALTPSDNDLLVYELSTDLWKNKSFSTLGLATLASPAFTGTPTAPTAAAATNTTQIATTAFVQQEVPAASTTAAGKVELATNAEALTGTSTTLAVTPSTVPWAISSGNIQRLDFINNTAVSGSGAVTTTTSGYRQIFLTSAGSAGRASFSAGVVGSLTILPGFDNFRQLNFSKKMWLSGKFAANHASTTAGDANNIFSVSLGGYTTGMTGDMTVKGIGLKKVGGASSVIELVVHNGTSQSVVATTKAVGTAEVVEWMIYSDGTGNVTLYINGSQAATSSAGPTGATADAQGVYREQVEQTASAATRLVANCYSGQLIIER